MGGAGRKVRRNTWGSLLPMVLSAFPEAGVNLPSLLGGAGPRGQAASSFGLGFLSQPSTAPILAGSQSSPVSI